MNDYKKRDEYISDILDVISGLILGFIGVLIISFIV